MNIIYSYYGHGTHGIPYYESAKTVAKLAVLC